MDQPQFMDGHHVADNMATARLLQNAYPIKLKTKTKLRGLSPHANYTDRAATADRRS